MDSRILCNWNYVLLTDSYVSNYSSQATNEDITDADASMKSFFTGLI